MPLKRRGVTAAGLLKKHEAQNEQIAKGIAEGENLAAKASLINQVSEITALIYAKPDRAKKVLAALHKGYFDATFQDPKEYFNS